MKRKRKWNPKKFFACGKPWYEKWGFWSGCVVIFILIPLIINYIYMMGLELQNPNTIFSASDLLSFYGSTLTFLGTFTLGTFAYKQTEIHHRRNMEAELANTLCPYLEIESVTYNGNIVSNFEKNHYTVYNTTSANIRIKNIGQGVACGVTYSISRVFGRRPRVEVDVDDYISLSIPINESFNYPLKTVKRYENFDVICSKEIHYQNVLGYRYSQTLSYKLTVEYSGEDDEIETVKLLIYNLSKQTRIGT